MRVHHTRFRVIVNGAPLDDPHKFFAGAVNAGERHARKHKDGQAITVDATNYDAAGAVIDSEEVHEIRKPEGVTA